MCQLWVNLTSSQLGLNYGRIILKYVNSQFRVIKKLIIQIIKHSFPYSVHPIWYVESSNDFFFLMEIMSDITEM